MSIHFDTEPRSMDAAMAILGNRQSYVIGRNTRLRVDGELATIRLHNTDIVQFRPDGGCLLNSGGWQTPTTKERMNRYLPAGWSIYQEAGVWWIEYGSHIYFQPTQPSSIGPPKIRVSMPFADHITVWPNGDYRMPAQYAKPTDLAIQREAVNNYARGFVEALQAGEVQPSNGDCFMCRGFMGDNSGPEHIRSHIEEPYYVGSLLLRILESPTIGMSPAARSWVASHLTKTGEGWTAGSGLNGICSDQTTKAIVKYCREQLGMVR